METITEINNNDLIQYYKTLSNKCKIRVIRSKIYNSMPKTIKDEFKQKINDLEEIGAGKFVIKARNASDELNKFLSKHVFKLIDVVITDVDSNII